MSLFDTTQTALERALSGASLRQETLAGNLANVNTPGYQRRDVDFHDALRGALAAGDPAAAQFAVTTASPGPVRADGGTVDADVESATLAKNGLEYEALATVAKARLGILEAAIGTGR